MPARVRIDFAFRDEVAAHPAGDDGLAGGVRVGREMLGDCGGIGHALGREDDEHAVGVRDPSRRFRGLWRSDPASASPRMSTGLLWLQASGRKLL